MRLRLSFIFLPLKIMEKVYLEIWWFYNLIPAHQPIHVSKVSSKVLVEVGSQAVWGPVEQLAQMSALSLPPTPHACYSNTLALALEQ